MTMLNNNGGKGFGKNARKLVAPTPLEQARQALIQMHLEDQVNDLVEHGKVNGAAGTIVMRDDLSETWDASVGWIYVFGMTSLDVEEDFGMTTLDTKDVGIATRFTLTDETVKNDELVQSMQNALWLRAHELSDPREFTYTLGYIPSIQGLFCICETAKLINELQDHWQTSNLKETVLKYINLNEQVYPDTGILTEFT